jgi:hypothetical protein
MANLARRLIAEEHDRRDTEDSEARAAFRVCDKLRAKLTPLAGARGFRALMGRALALSEVEVPSLAKLQVGAGGSLLLPAALEQDLGKTAAARAGAVLVANLLGLLTTFIGEALTLRLVKQTWPKAALDGSNAGMKK